MSLSHSSMLPLGTEIPSFSLLDSNEVKHQLDKGSFNGYILAFICNHCPYVINIKDKMSQILNAALEKDFSVYAINSNDSIKYPLDNAQMIKKDIIEYKYKFPYLVDKSQYVGKKFQTVCTPEFYIFNNKKLLVYRGRFDDSSPGNNKLARGDDIKKVINFINQGKPVPKSHFPSMGCSIKWKEENKIH